MFNYSMEYNPWVFKKNQALDVDFFKGLLRDPIGMLGN